MSGRPPKAWSPRRARWTLNLYPPFLANRIVVRRIAPDWRSLDLTVERSLLNRNLNGTTFGGSLSSAADPIHAVLFWQALARRGQACRAWTKSLSVQFLRPAASRVSIRFEIPAEDVEEASAAVAAGKRFERSYVVSAIDEEGVSCTRQEIGVHVRGKTP